MANSDWIRIRGLAIDCIVGLYPHERDQLQPLVLDAELCLDTEPAARRERMRLSVDYAAISDELAFLVKNSRFRMLETAAHALSRYLLAPPAPGERRARITRVRLRLEKPTAIGGRAVPSLEIEREAAGVDIGQEHKAFGTVDVIHETQDAGIYRLNIAPGRDIPLHHHLVMQEAEMVLTDGLWCQGKPVARGTVHRWPRGAAHCYHNPTRKHQTVLCVDSPPFMPIDEISADGEPAQVRAEA